MFKKKFTDKHLNYWINATKEAEHSDSPLKLWNDQINSGHKNPHDITYFYLQHTENLLYSEIKRCYDVIDKAVKVIEWYGIDCILVPTDSFSDITHIEDNGELAKIFLEELEKDDTVAVESKYLK